MGTVPTVADALRPVVPAVSAGVVSPAAAARLVAAGATVPLVSGFGIECSPPATDRADLAIRLLQGEPATRAVLRGEPIAWAGPAAEALQRLARRWWGASRPDAPPGSRILWLERDLAESVTGTSLFAGPHNPPDGPPDGCLTRPSGRRSPPRCRRRTCPG
ncbi:MAG TPA: hypothetical protein VMU34_20020 [Mycobacterium sp.]|nr:hypothetical protein [Mycobacterium sp.]